MKLIIYTDGGARGNPGPAGAGFVIYDFKETILCQKGEFLGEQTNNYAEYMALILSLKEALKLGGSEVEVRMDSQLIVRQIQGIYKIKQPHLHLLAEEVFSLLKKFSVYKFVHVPREQNKEADKMVNQVLDREV